MLRLVLAVGINGEVGSNDPEKMYMPWPRLKGDLENFRKVTKDTALLMGHSTYKVASQYLKNKTQIVLTSRYVNKRNFVRVSEALNYISPMIRYHGPISVIGGAKTAETFAGLYNEMIITHVKGAFPGCTRVNLNKLLKGYVKRSYKVYYDDDSGISYTIATYRKKQLPALYSYATLQQMELD